MTNRAFIVFDEPFQNLNLYRLQSMVIRRIRGFILNGFVAIENAAITAVIYINFIGIHDTHYFY